MSVGCWFRMMAREIDNGVFTLWIGANSPPINHENKQQGYILFSYKYE
jgi:hypothetical protein